ncbi:beta-carotene 15,15'-monooxygenase [Corynebacterium comes]|uniref:Beta-carotene 15,15'-monooxygenase n=1 Tax=Corynebacterium comes TaxID=2675218 RepID=A0A6B8WBZ3_9CORY|nr:beta-carotene 15,15'-monooxygenase [Corynebacterium comes]QGU04348.1 hypothetical protein CETAM_05390 [Corynebacterium comes]
MSDLSLSDVSLRKRGRHHTLAAATVGVWMLIGPGIILARALGAPISWWTTVHSFTLGVLTTAILVYSTHFTEALTRTAGGDYRGVVTRVGLVQVGLVLLIVGKAGDDWGALADFAATLVIGAVLWHMAVIRSHLRRSLAGQFAVTVPFYLTAGAFLVVAGLLGNFAGRGVGDYAGMIAGHSRAAIWGFAFLTVLGTVITLLPTLSGTRISDLARRRCTRALILHGLGLSAVIVAHILVEPIWAGILQLLVVVAALLILQPVLAGVFSAGPTWSTSAVSVTAGLLWLIAVCAADAVSTLAGADPRHVTALLIPAFLAAGLLQLVLGVLLHLLPVLVGGGRARVLRARAAADRAGMARVLLINLGAVFILLAESGPARVVGLIMLGLGLFAHVAFLVPAVVRQHRTESS